MKTLIIGADGQLGTDLCKVIPKEEQIPLTIKDIDITDKEQVLRVIKRYSPEIVINTAAYHQVDNCEDNEAAAFAVNALGARFVARACRETDAALVHISTDYVFDGAKKSPYLESDVPNPLSVYAVSKLAGEFCVKAVLEKHFIVRSSGLYGAAGCMGKGGGNCVENMLKRAENQPELKVVTDEVLAPTYTLDLAKKIAELIRTKHYGLYHIVNHGQCSWYDFTVKIFELLGKKIKILPVTSAEFTAKVRRPAYSVLQNAKLAELGMDDMRSWEEALRAYLYETGHSSRLS
ncbi:dTDP-4-dehydrorhamnose reductase [Candidatus Saganbacteria bacterium]|uniref:dTDP-4-dehydrorhamnose reductase n=1 Tax=Candidatus Saganbacteria bacterium TaxID=2575572 RepID=A0A9D6UN98_UNCSA|nr:dTDP-4-dehydrorhamnose reductase [Candidatus Saganbacteria bacterium]